MKGQPGFHRVLGQDHGEPPVKLHGCMCVCVCVELCARVDLHLFACMISNVLE